MASLDVALNDMDVDQQTGIQTAPYAEDVPVPALPMSHPYKETQFYVRKCYPEYYKQIQGLFDGPLIDHGHRDSCNRKINLLSLCV